MRSIHSVVLGVCMMAIVVIAYRLQLEITEIRGQLAAVDVTLGEAKQGLTFLDHFRSAFANSSRTRSPSGQLTRSTGAQRGPGGIFQSNSPVPGTLPVSVKRYGEIINSNDQSLVPQLVEFLGLTEDQKNKGNSIIKAAVDKLRIAAANNIDSVTINGPISTIKINPFSKETDSISTEVQANLASVWTPSQMQQFQTVDVAAMMDAIGGGYVPRTITIEPSAVTPGGFEVITAFATPSGIPIRVSQNIDSEKFQANYGYLTSKSSRVQ